MRGRCVSRRVEIVVAMSLTTVLMLANAPCAADDFTVHQDDAGVTVEYQGKLLTRYLVRSGAKPVLWPLVGPTGAELTRGYPLRPATAEERSDHIHQRSFWFTHGDVNGVSFWHEEPGHGTIAHRDFGDVRGGETARIVTHNDWLDGQGAKLLEDERRLEFAAAEGQRWIDFDIVLTATSGKVTWGDTKEGTFGLRVAGTMDVKAGGGGRIVNREGLADDAAWGKRSAWVDYSGPVAGNVAGITIFNHPASFRFPTYWHVRDYGLFAANPFGWQDFENSPQLDGRYVLESGQTLSLFYRVLLHAGPGDPAQLEAAFLNYARLPKPAP